MQLTCLAGHRQDTSWIITCFAGARPCKHYTYQDCRSRSGRSGSRRINVLALYLCLPAIKHRTYITLTCTLVSLMPFCCRLICCCATIPQYHCFLTYASAHYATLYTAIAFTWLWNLSLVATPTGHCCSYGPAYVLYFSSLYVYILYIQLTDEKLM